MPEQEMLLDSATIKAAVAGEKWATEKVIEHYAPMIDELAVDEDKPGPPPGIQIPGGGHLLCTMLPHGRTWKRHFLPPKLHTPVPFHILLIVPAPLPPF